MIIVFESILPVFTLVLLGYLLRKKQLIAPENWKSIEDLCFWILFPALLISTMVEADLSSIDLGPFTLTFLLMIASVSGFTLLLWPLLHHYWGSSRGQFSTIYQTSTRWHGFIALAIVIKLYGAEGGALVAVAFTVMVPILQITNIFVLAAFSTSHPPTLANISKMVATNPIIAGVLIGLLLNLSSTRLWPPLMDMFDLLGRAALGLSLLALGAGLSLRAALKPSRELLVGLFIKLFLTPLVTIGWALWLGVSGVPLSVVVVCASVSTAMNGYIFAKKMGGDAELYAATASTQTAVSFLSMPFFIWLVQRYAGGA